MSLSEIETFDSSFANQDDFSAYFRLWKVQKWKRQEVRLIHIMPNLSIWFKKSCCWFSCNGKNHEITMTISSYNSVWSWLPENTEENQWSYYISFYILFHVNYRYSTLRYSTLRNWLKLKYVCKSCVIALCLPLFKWYGKFKSSLCC